MATPPTFVGTVATSWNATTSPRSATSSLTLSANDILVGLAADANNETGAQNYTFGPGTFVEQTLNEGGSGANTSTGCPEQTATQVQSSGGTVTPTIAATQTGTVFGAAFAQFSGSDGVGAQAQSNNGTGSGAPSMTITTTQDNSAVVAIFADWNAADGASATYRTVNGITPVRGGAGELAYFRSSADYTVYVVRWSDVGAAGAKTIGLSAPSTMRWTGVAVEIKGAAGGGSTSVPVSDAVTLSELATGVLIVSSNVDADTLSDASSVASTLSVSDSASASDSSSSQLQLTRADAATLSDSSSLVQSSAVSGVDAAALSDASALTPTLSASDSVTLSDATPALAATLSVSDSDTLSDSSSVTQTGSSPSVSDTQTHSEQPTLIVATASTSDAASVADASAQLLDALSRSDSASASDSSSSQLQLTRADSSSVSDASVPQLLLRLLLFDSSALSELAQRVGAGGHGGFVHSWFGGATLSDSTSSRGASLSDNAGSMSHGGTISGS